MRAVILTRHYPPEISGGARRPYALAHSLRALGVEVVVVAPVGAVDPHLVGVPHPTYPSVPESNSSYHNCHIGQKPSFSLGDWMRLNFLLPDPEIRWALRAARAAKDAVKEAEWFLTTSPPESLHVAGRLLKAWTGTKWVADVRDLWLESPQLVTRSQQKLRCTIEREIAKACLGCADALVGVSPIVLKEAEQLARKPLRSAVIGHFALPYEGPHAKLPTETFNIVHTGAIGLSNPLSSFKHLLGDFEALLVKRANARLWLAGHLTDVERAQIAASSAHSAIIQLGPVALDAARALQAGADALALVSGPNSHALPGKFAEYMTTGKPILISAPGPWTDLVPDLARTMPFQEAERLAKSDRDIEARYQLAAGATGAALALIDLVQNSQTKR